jgi:quercetin dioxygenase-like cupin family protein
VSAPVTFEAPGFHGRVTGMLGEIMVIEADLDGEIASHAATSDEFAVVIDGRIRVIIDGETAYYGPGDYLIVPTGTEHAIFADVPSRLILIGTA